MAKRREDFELFMFDSVLGLRVVAVYVSTVQFIFSFCYFEIGVDILRESELYTFRYIFYTDFR